MAFSLKRLANSLPLSGLFRNLEQDMETVVKVLHPGPLGIIEHKFSAEEIRKATETVKKAVQNWKRNAKVEQHSPFLKDFIDNEFSRILDSAPGLNREYRFYVGVRQEIQYATSVQSQSLC